MFEVKIKLTEDLLGTVPKDKEVFLPILRLKNLKIRGRKKLKMWKK